MGREEFGPRAGEGYVAFHARLFEKAEQADGPPPGAAGEDPDRRAALRAGGVRHRARGRRRRGPHGRLGRAGPDPVSAGSGPRWPTSRWPARTVKELAADVRGRPRRPPRRVGTSGLDDRRGRRSWRAASPRRGRRSSACDPTMLRTKAERAAPVRHRRRAGRIAAGRVGRRGRGPARGPVRGLPGPGHADRDLAARADGPGQRDRGRAGRRGRSRRPGPDGAGPAGADAGRAGGQRRRPTAAQFAGGGGAGAGRAEPGDRRGHPGVRGDHAAGARARAPVVVGRGRGRPGPAVGAGGRAAAAGLSGARSGPGALAALRRPRVGRAAEGGRRGARPAGRAVRRLRRRTRPPGT